MNTIGALIGIYVAFRLIKQGVQEIRKLEYSCNRCGSNTNDDISTSDYFQYCPNCDEDMYKFEVRRS